MNRSLSTAVLVEGGGGGEALDTPICGMLAMTPWDLVLC